jgi:hypothetical protein
MEIKRKGGHLSTEQLCWIRRMRMCGYEAKAVYGVDEGIQAIKNYVGVR